MSKVLQDFILSGILILSGGIFLAALVISLSTPRNLLLQYIPNAYTSGGVVSWTGAAVLGGSAVVIAHTISIFIASMGL